MQRDELSDQERAILDFEAQYWYYTGAKEKEIRARFNLSPTQYYLRLSHLLDRPAAMAAKPAVVRRLRSQRESRDAARSWRQNYRPER
ncbi:MAG: DUF3263 domain-containing protein [Bowdeniella nasicola]|nr:DUF3263 domain-containing protein [Bowdeniella nasicola]